MGYWRQEHHGMYRCSNFRQESDIWVKKASLSDYSRPLPRAQKILFYWILAIIAATLRFLAAALGWVTLSLKALQEFNSS
jgi:hypothetical protein